MTDDLVKRLRDQWEATPPDICHAAADRIEALETALRKICKDGEKVLKSTWDSPPESVRQDAAHLWGHLAICVDYAEDALGEKNDGTA